VYVYIHIYINIYVYVYRRLERRAAGIHVHDQIQVVAFQPIWDPRKFEARESSKHEEGRRQKDRGGVPSAVRLSW